MPTELACRASAGATWIVDSDYWFYRFNQMVMPIAAAESVSNVASLQKQINTVPGTLYGSLFYSNQLKKKSEVME